MRLASSRPSSAPEIAARPNYHAYVQLSLHHPKPIDRTARSPDEAARNPGMRVR